MSTLLLHTIPFSHYCDYARWSLQRANVDFEERASLPGLHLVNVSQHRWEAGGGRSATTPLLTRDSNSIGAYTLGWLGVGKDLVGNDSWAIADWAESHMPAHLVRPAPPAELKSLLNDVIGPCGRSWVYSYFLAADANGDRATGRPVTLLCSDAAISSTQRWLWSKAGNKIANTMHDGMVKSDEHIAQCVVDLDRGLARLAELLADESALGPEMIADGVPNRNHLAIAAICYPLVFPPQSMVPFFGREVITVADVPPPMAAQVERYRATPAGQMTLRVYAACRLAVVKQTSGDSQ